MKMDGVTEHCEGRGVHLFTNENERLVIQAFNESGYNCTEVDLVELINWLKQERPDLL